jgi:peptidoglycan/xylan/chitin deacetylase (PgdA/CDA1 family)
VKKTISIIMYHYVRPLGFGAYGNIKALDLQVFIKQVKQLSRSHTFVSIEQVMSALSTASCKDLPGKSVVLTFDDGYLDHYSHVFPFLHDRKIPAAFYPCSAAVMQLQALEISKIHYILATLDGKIRWLIEEIHGQLMRQGFTDAQINDLRQSHYVPSKLDTSDVAYVKRVLQYGIDDPPRRKIIDHLFTNHVTSDESSFCANVFMNKEQLRIMRECGMHIGGHGARHLWLNRVSQDVVTKEITSSKEMLDSLGCAGEWLSFCYPFGAFNDSVINALAVEGFRVGLTTQENVVECVSDQLDAVNALALPRIDAVNVGTYLL